MGFFKKISRVAEGGGGALATASASGAALSLKGSEATNLDIFGADSDESDDDAIIDRFAKNGGEELDASEAAKANKRKKAELNSKLTPEELFTKYDTDNSGNISASEFLAMLPDLGIFISAAKAMRIFRKCDTDGGGEIDLNEFRMAMFAVDPVSGNLSPSTLLGPRDVFDLFDEDGTGQIDELEFADVLEYFGTDVSDAKQETIFKKFDKDKSGKIDYQEFRSMWINLVDVREELVKRRIQIPNHARIGKLQQMLEAILDEEETRDALALEEAQRFLQRQRNKEHRERLGKKAVLRAQEELAAALDAAGQVYVMGSGKYNQFCGTPAARVEELFPDFKAVSEIWSSRVAPPDQTIHARELKSLSADSKRTKANTRSCNVKEDLAKDSTTQPGHTLDSKYVRRRLENKRWKFQSPPRLNRLTLLRTKAHIRAIEREQDKSDERGESDQGMTLSSPTVWSEVEEITHADCSQNEEEIAKLYFENREFVRSLRFRSCTLMSNTGPMWGQSVVQGAISDSVAFAVTNTGRLYSWGGRKTTWNVSDRQLAGFDSESDDEAEYSDQMIRNDTTEIEVQDKITPRSASLKMYNPKHLIRSRFADAGAKRTTLRNSKVHQNEENLRFELLKRVILYYDMWETPPSNATRMQFLEQVLLPKIEYELLLTSSQLRGLELEHITKMDLMLALGECFELEVEVKGEAGHASLKDSEGMIKLIGQDKTGFQEKEVKLLRAEKDRMLQEWQVVKTLREKRQAERVKEAKAKAIEKINCLDHAYESRTTQKVVQLESTVSEFTSQDDNLLIKSEGATGRNPSPNSRRGGVTVANVSAGGSHVTLLMQDGSLYTCGIGSSGRLGLQPNDQGVDCFDTSQPHRVEAFNGLTLCQVSSSFSHSAAIDSNGSLYTWGSACSGKLGVGVVKDKYKQYSLTPLPVPFPGKRSIRSVSCGASHTGAASTAGELFMWGSANGGRLGLGPHVVECVVVPTLVEDLMNKEVRVWQVSCGVAHSAFCTEITSEFSKGSTSLLGGQVYVCGGATALNRFVLSWERIAEFDGLSICQVACGGGHTAAVSSFGELYTWGRNAHGCTGHDASRVFIEKPELLRCLHVEPYNLAFGKPSRQISTYNEQGPYLAVNGQTGGALATCIHTQIEDNPWWEVDLGQLAVIKKIRLWNRTDEPLDLSKNRSEYSRRLFPCWIFVSESAFIDLDGKEGIRAAKLQSSAFEMFHTDQRMTEWILPAANTVGQFVRVQLQNKNFLHFAEVEVFGVNLAFDYVGKVGTVQCSADATLVIIPPISTQSVVDDYYLRAIQADADNATILCQYEAYKLSFRKFGRGSPTTLGGACRLCRVFRKCEICEFYASTKFDCQTLSDDKRQAFPLRIACERMGLKEFIKVALAEDTLHAEQQAQICEEQAAADVNRQHTPDRTRNKRQSRLLKLFQALH